MAIDVARKLAELQQQDVKTLVARYAELFGEQTNTRNKAWLVKRILWRLQAREEGDLSERARMRAAELADDADLRLSPPKMKACPTAPTVTVPFNPSGQTSTRIPPAGSILHRRYKGRDLQVLVLAEGFEYEGENFKSLSAIANRITGSHCNGYLFFRLNKEAQHDSQ
jgi:hypothetical protein